MTDFATLRGSHDLQLSAWGPYTKRYMGISHIPDVSAGLRFDLSVFPGLYRRSVNVPTVLWESGYHPWAAAPDLSYFSHRHEVVWKDQVYCDVAFCRLDETAALIHCTCANRTEEPYNLVLHYMASLHFPPIQTNSFEVLQPSYIDLPPGALWVNSLDYETLHYARFDPRANLVYDGHRRGEVRAHGFVDGTALGEGFGANEGDFVTYHLTAPDDIIDARLLLRYRMPARTASRFALSGLVETEITLEGRGELELHEVEIGIIDQGENELTLTAHGNAAIKLDGFVLVTGENAEQVRFEPVAWKSEPKRIDGPRDNTLVLKYANLDPMAYGLAWGAQPAEVREFICDDLDSWMRYTVHHHVQEVFRSLSGGGNHYTNIFMRPIFLAPASERIICGLVCTGDTETVQARLEAFDPAPSKWEKVHQETRARAVDITPNPSGEPYHAGQTRMAATTLTNIVYPVRTRGTWIRHSCPGRWWDSLYTWDSGFIGLGLLELDIERAIDNLNAYVTEPDEEDAAFIHHGSPVPTQFYLFLELWNRTQSRELLTYFYPRLQRYHRFLAGRQGSSTTRTLASNLLRTWDYFYNSGGWDDYPPQFHVHANSLQATVAPVINTAQAIRTAKILRMAALALGKDTVEYDKDIATFTEALQKHAWDEEAGYFGYVVHDDERQPSGLLRHESGANFNMGMDGASPLVAGACTTDQETRLTGHLMSPDRMWCEYGISTVDQSAPYYRDDGYWNGAVWMPHQWFFWKALLDLGMADEAHRIAETALGIWQREVSISYNCFEHFIVQTGRGAGWHHFGGLSTPVLMWYGAYHRPGRLTTGLNTWVERFDDKRALDAELKCFGAAHHTPIIIVTLTPGASYAVTWEGKPIKYNERYPGTLEIRLPAGTTGGHLTVTGS